MNVALPDATLHIYLGLQPALEMHLFVKPSGWFRSIVPSISLIIHVAAG